MNEWQQRVVDERIELEGRISRLAAFLQSDRAKQVELMELDRMSRQLSYMQAYSSVLGERISCFGDPSCIHRT